MKTFSANTRHNKAAMLLASMSADMVEDIVDLVQLRGRQLIALTDEADGPPKPLAVLSRSFIDDADFPYVYTGLLTTILASMRTLQSDNDFYQSTLMKAFSLPREIAEPIAKQIETYDILGGVKEADKRAWYTKASQAIQEQIRKSVNWGAGLLNSDWENDQDQQYDIDYLYELRLFGEQVDKLNSRARLMRSQAAISSGLKLFMPADSESGDVFGDSEDDAELAVGDAIAPLVGSPLPLSVMGGFSSLARMGKAASTARFQTVLAKAGHSQHSSHKHNGVKHPKVRRAVDKILQAKPGKLALAAGAVGFAPFAIKAIASVVKKMKVGQAMGDVTDNVTDLYGDVAGHHFKAGNIGAFLAELLGAAGPLETTGDPAMDELIIGDVSQDIAEDEAGDPDSIYGDAEIGGLLKRIRTNMAIRRGNRRQRRAATKTGNQNRRNSETYALQQAKDFANSQGYSQANYDDAQGYQDSGDQGDYSGGYDPGLSQF